MSSQYEVQRPLGCCYLQRGGSKANEPDNDRCEAHFDGISCVEAAEVCCGLLIKRVCYFDLFTKLLM